MKLYFKAGACSLAPHIVMSELNMVYEVEAVDTAKKTSASGDFWQVNPKGYIPALRMENGEILTEGAIISQYLVDQKTDSTLMPKFGTLDRYRCMEWMNYIATEIHKGYNPLFKAQSLLKSVEAQNEFKDSCREVLSQRLNFVSEKLGENDFLMGKTFTIADAYLFACLNWSKFVGMDNSRWPNLAKYCERIAARPAVQKAMKEEGLI